MKKMRFQSAPIVVTMALVIAACGGSTVTDATDEADETATTEVEAETTTEAPPETQAPEPTTAPTTAPPATTSAPTTAAPTTEAPQPTGEWITQSAGSGCVCADGSDYIYFTRTIPESTKVLLYFQGGGACFNETMCAFEGGTYDVTSTPEDSPVNFGGIFDFDNPANPFADYNIVFMPYCTGDVHLGDATTPYGDSLTVEHNGFPNAMHGLDWITANHADATEVFVTGSSAGGVPAPLFGALVADALPDAEVAALADASGGYPSNPGVNAFIGGLWGTEAAIPSWPELEGSTAADFGIPDLLHLAGNHNPDLRLARYDNANDAVQVSFSALAGVGDGGLPAVLDQNEQLVEGNGVNLPVYIAPGTNHTILAGQGVYDLEVEGVSFLDWLNAFIDGEDPGDVRCVECEGG